jgi:DNA-binding MarR family transcriptional regulator
MANRGEGGARVSEQIDQNEPDAGDTGSADIFSFFNEIGIINQLSLVLFAKTLPCGVHPSHFAIVNHLVRTGDGKTPVRIANAMQITKATMTHSLRILEDRGFITVKPNPHDARGKIVLLTDAGRSFREAAIASAVSEFAPIFDSAQIERMSRIYEDLVELRKHLDENRLP